jgi:PAS domain S-box-containing protein
MQKTMDEPVRILIVEDFPPDVELAEREIKKTFKSCLFRSAETRENYLSAIKEFHPDLIISDFRMPRFTGLEVLKLAQEHTPHTPVIIFTGAQNEDTAVECMKNGAADYVIKEHIKRLGHAIIHALEEKQLREERSRVEIALRASEERFRSLYENAIVGIYRIAPDGRLLMANPAAVRMLGFDSVEELENNDLSKSVFVSSMRNDDIHRRLLARGTISGLEDVWLKKDGSSIHVRESIRIARDRNGNIIYYDGTFEDITEQKRVVEALTLFSHTIKSIGECISITDLENKLLFVNEAFLETYGYRELDIIGKSISIVTCDKKISDQEVLKATLKGGWQGERMNRKRDGTEFPVFLSTSVVHNEQGQPIALVGVASDITERQRAEEQLRASLIEKEVLIKETHHRVKNNLQVISSLLNLQSELIIDPRDKVLFDESQSRIKSMALIHEQLYRSRSLSAIDFKEYVQMLSTEMMRSYAKEGISLEQDVADIQFSLDVAIPCGLIINELLSNALKHAFSGREEGRINIRLTFDGDNTFNLVVNDNGIGLPDNVNVQNTTSLGFQLIITLTNQLQGKINIERKAGTTISISFPKE